MDNGISQNQPIENWQHFNSIVRPKGHLLKKLGIFQNAILVSGCQRSGTTMLAGIINKSSGMENYCFGNYSFGSDDELDSALILAGHVNHTPGIGRYCFQTTYLSENYREYYEHVGKFKLIWVIRNPYSVIYSLLYNWPRYALDRNFEWTSNFQMNLIDKIYYSLLGSKFINPVKKACLLYRAKILQLLELVEKLDQNTVFVVDYDNLVLKKDTILPQIYQFIDLEYSSDYSQKIHSKSIEKKFSLSNAEKKVIRNMIESLYHKARLLLSTN